ncbi:MAG: protein phosphatase 2C domain-containing protein [Gemmatimonadaceae bacterium]|nr:protein phosphatase 2C domain-containing protein [Gemmatimonadaceae bacterium]
MRDETEAPTPPVPEAIIEPASWSSRAPDAEWAPAPLVEALGERFITMAAAEPCTIDRQVDGWAVLGASVRGKSHGHRGEHRDDAIACVSRDGLLVMAVADGAGSSALSRIGAAVVADIATHRTAARFAADGHNADTTSRLGTAMAHAVHDAAMRLHALAAAAAEPPTAFRTTLLLVAMVGDTMLVSQVGDGAVLVQQADGRVLRVGGARDTMWAGEVTCFVPDPCAMTAAAEFRQLRTSDVALVALLTDGIDDPFHPLEQSGDRLVSQWRHGTTESIGVARQPPAGAVLGDAAALLTWMGFEQRGESDDRSLLLAWRDVAVTPPVTPPVTK